MKSYSLCGFLLLINYYVANAQTIQIAADNVNMRSCGGLECPMVNMASKGEICTFIQHGKLENVSGYGTHAWWLVKCGAKEGYVFSGLLDVTIEYTSNEVPVSKTGYVKDDVNVRICPSTVTQDCPIYAQLAKGTYVEAWSRVGQPQDIGDYGTDYWYYIKAGTIEGYVFGGLLAFQPNELTIDSMNVPIYTNANLQSVIVHTANRGTKYSIIKQSETSDLIRPYGRHYWYQIKDENMVLGWVYGVFTSHKAFAVNCQCVDYLKEVLSIKGPTKNAFEWDEVLQGNIPLDINGVETYLHYKEITDFNQTQKGDIVMFNNNHPEVNPSYGHVGILEQVKTENNATVLIIEGANHKLPMKVFYEKSRCNNVSKKTYQYKKGLVRFFRK